MLILLPPSEGKTPPAAGDPVDLGALAFPELTERRERLLGALVRTSAGRPATALKALGLGPGQRGELERNAALREAPAAPAAEVYTGVLYERLALGGLPAGAAARAADAILIASALWGMLRPRDRIPAYRMSMGARLPRLGAPAAFWRPALEQALPDGGLVVDMRSGAYAAAWRPRTATVVAVRAFSLQPGGARKPISHMAKRARGDVARALLLAGDEPAGAADVAEIARAAGLRTEVSADGAFVDVLE